MGNTVAQRIILWIPLYFRRISSSVILNLECQKGMHGLQCVGIVCADPYLPSPFSWLERVSNRIVLIFHGRHAGRHSVMNEHRDIEITSAEHCRDMLQVHPDLVAGRIVAIALCIDFDNSTVEQEREMMSCGFV